MTAYYNEFDPKAAAWLRELIKRGLIADGEVDERSILDVSAEDLVDFTQCHFFAGIGGWSYALGLAGWPDDRPVWTGSPPCQPFSAAGQNKGKDDDRHLAPHFATLVAAGRPPLLFGEQVASAAVFGKVAKRAGGATEGESAWAWIDDLQDRLEAAHYAVGVSDIPAAGVGAPHIRQRTFFGAVRLADAECGERGSGGLRGFRQADGSQSGRSADEPTRDRDGSGLGHPSGAAGERDTGGVSGTEAQEHGAGVTIDGDLPVGPEHAGTGMGGMADVDMRRRKPEPNAKREGVFGKANGQTATGQQPSDNCTGAGLRQSNPTNGFWAGADWLFCRDGKWRPVEPGTLPLADGVSARVVRLRGYGNAIVPQAAAAFIEAFMQAHQEAAQ